MYFDATETPSFGLSFDAAEIWAETPHFSDAETWADLASLGSHSSASKTCHINGRFG
jgi:hypothetical protein